MPKESRVVRGNTNMVMLALLSCWILGLWILLAEICVRDPSSAEDGTGEQVVYEWEQDSK